MSFRVKKEFYRGISIMGYGGDRVGEYFSVRVSNIDKNLTISIPQLVAASAQVSNVYRCLC